MPNKWIEHVKQYASYHNIPYNQAIKEAKSSYNKGSVMIGSGGGASRPIPRPIPIPRPRQRPIIDDPQIIHNFHLYMFTRTDMSPIDKTIFRGIIRKVMRNENTDEEMTEYNRELGDFLDSVQGDFASIVEDI